MAPQMSSQSLGRHLPTEQTILLGQRERALSWLLILRLSLLTAEDIWFFLQPRPKIHTSHPYLQDLHWFEAIFKNFVCAVLEVIEVEWWSMLNFDAATSKFCNYSWMFGSWPWKGKVDVCMTVPKFWFIWFCYISYCITYKSTVKN